MQVRTVRRMPAVHDKVSVLRTDCSLGKECWLWHVRSKRDALRAFFEAGGWHRLCILDEMEPVAEWPTESRHQAYPYQERLERRVSTSCRVTWHTG